MDKTSSSPSSSTASADGLKFGKKIYFEGVGSGPDTNSGGVPAKRGRNAGLQNGVPPRCQVEGCDVDLSDAKPYHSRHKVCGVHSKSARVVVAGIEQRFCQQCSRFHQLSEFDQGKRSCRRRLAGHNERRRKPPPGSSFSSRYGNLCPSMFEHSKTGSFMMDFSTYAPSSSLTGGRDPWLLNPTEQPKYHHHLSWQSTPETNNPFSEFLSISSEECLSGAEQSTGALSLLSNHHNWGTRARSPSHHGFSNFLGSESAHPEQPGAPELNQFNFSPWSYKPSNHVETNLQELQPDLGLGQAQHTVDTRYFGELGLGQPNDGEYPELDHSRGYGGSSVHHMHWSL